MYCYFRILQVISLTMISSRLPKIFPEGTTEGLQWPQIYIKTVLAVRLPVSLVLQIIRSF